MSKILLKSMEQNINYLNSNETASGYMMRPLRYSTIYSTDLIETISRNSYVPKAYVSATFNGIEDAVENYLLNGHTIQLGSLGFLSLTCDSKVAKTSAEAGLEQFKRLNINFRPSITLKEKLEDVEVELEGVWKCLDLTADKKIYERISTNHNETELPDNENNEANQGGNSGGGNSNPGGDFVG